MPVSWVTVDDVLQAVADDLHKGDKAQLRTRWTAIATRAVERAHSDLIGILTAKGYTIAQLEGWDDRARYARDQALFWAYVEGAALDNPSDRDYNKLDNRQALIKGDISILINGGVVLPGLSDAAIGGSVLTGVLNTSSNLNVSPSTFDTQAYRRSRDAGRYSRDEWE